jgi:putative endonuclease
MPLINLLWLSKMVIVYVLQGKEERYIGITNNLARRLAEHRSGRTKGGQIIKDFALFYRKQCPDCRSAREREKFLKSGAGREYLDCLKERSWSASGG